MRPCTPMDIPSLTRLTADTGMFRASEVEVLDEVLADYFSENAAAGHRCEVLQPSGEAVLGYVYYAPAAMTDRTWYLYWIAVDVARQGGGIGARMLAHVEASIRTERGRVLFIETSSLPVYEPTRRFYLKNGYVIDGQLRDFYADGDDMVVFRKHLQG